MLLFIIMLNFVLFSKFVFTIKVENVGENPPKKGKLNYKSSHLPL